jgi:hypothetical protein
MDRDEAPDSSPEEGQDAEAPDLTALRPTILDAIGAARALTRTLKHLPDRLRDKAPADRAATRLHAALDRLTIQCDRVIGIRVYRSQEGATDGE